MNIFATVVNESMEDIKRQVGTMIREARKTKGWTQKELGQKIGLAEATVNQYESGKQNPTVTTLQRFSQAFDLDLFIKFQ